MILAYPFFTLIYGFIDFACTEEKTANYLTNYTKKAFLYNELASFETIYVAVNTYK